jgi:hypothetical protein
MSLQVDLHELTEGKGKQTNFGTMLLRLIFKADQHNKEQLRKGFPNAVKMVETYKDTGEILDLPYD